MDNEFYPTPPALAKRAWEKFKSRHFVRVLEPSAGRGDLAAQHPWEVNRYRHSRMPIIDCCEIDVTMHPALRARGWNVVGLDFLSMASATIYSHIILNPPFSHGAAHVLKAWESLWDGEIVAIINAQTLRNPHSRERQRLVELVAQYGEVEYIVGAFLISEAERKANVEVALIRLEKKADVGNDIVGNLLEEMARDAESGEGLAGDYRDVQALALPDSFVNNSVLCFDAAVSAMGDAVRSEARSRYYTALIGETMAVRNGVGATSKDDSTIDWVKSELANRYDGLKDRAWASMLRSSNVTARLSSKAQKRVESEFEEIKKLEFTARNVYGFLCGLVDSQAKIQLDMACDVFDLITKWHTDNGAFVLGWKSNDKHRTCGMRIKTTRFILPGHSNDGWRNNLSWESEQTLGDLDKVFAMLAGQYEPEVSLVGVFRTHFRALSDGARVSSSFFDVRYYSGIGTIHFFPRDRVLIDRLNRLVGRQRQWLPPEGVRVPEAFWLAYDSAEKIDKEVRKELGRGYRGMWWDNPLEDFNGDQRKSAAMARISAALCTVLDRHGIKIDAMLEDASEDQSSQQRRLLAA